jgi:hypothetical protein
MAGEAAAVGGILKHNCTLNKSALNNSLIEPGGWFINPRERKIEK